MAYSNICDIYDLGNFKSECDFHSVRLYSENIQITNEKKGFDRKNIILCISSRSS
jgi:hypothetical protein